jgi:glycosyltransferase involved in cell wall biosynthesis
MSSPSLTVVITCFAEGERLRRAVESLRQQTDPGFEILVVNDASTDAATNRICDELESRGTARVVHHERNGGLSAARNSGYAAMTGEVCVPLDADDTLPPGAIAAIRAELDRHPEADFVFGDYIRCDVERGLREEIDCSRLARGGRLAPEVLAAGEWIFYGGSPCRRRVWQAVGGYRPEHSYDTQDLDFWMRVMERGFTGRYVAGPIYCWHRSASGMNARTSPASWVRTRARNAAFYDRFGDGVAAREELLRNAISLRIYDCAKELAAELGRRGGGSLLATWVRAAPLPVLRAGHALWLLGRGRPGGNLSSAPPRPSPGSPGAR